MLPLFRIIHTDNIHASARPAVLQHKADTRTAKNTADNAAGERIVADERVHRYDRKQKRLRTDTQQRFQYEFPADCLICEYHKRDIQQKGNYTRNIKRKACAEECRAGGTDDLRQPEQPAVVQPHGNNKKVCADYIADCTDKDTEYPAPIVCRKLMFHIAFSKTNI